MNRTMMMTAVATLAGVAGAGHAQENQPMQAAKPTSPLLMTKYTIKDVPRNNSQPLATVLIPANWRAESELQWTLRTATIPFALKARFTAPSGAAAVELFPIPQGALNNSPYGVQGYAPRDVVEALTELVRAQRPGARIRLLDKKTNRLERVGGQQSPYAQTASFSQTGAIRVAYEVNGQAFEEEFAGTLYVMCTSAGQGYETRQWYIDFPRSIKAHKGKLDEFLPVGQAMCRSVRPTPELLMAIQVASQMAVNIRMQDIQLTALEGQMWLQANRQINAQWQQVCEQRWAADLRIAEQRRDILGGVQRFVGDHGREVIAPVNYSHLWENNQGYYLMTNDPSFRPGPEFNGTWSQLQPKY